MTQLVTTNLVVSFATVDSSATLSAEIDSRPEGLNKGSSSFVAGDSPGFMLYYTDGVVIDLMYPSEGNIVYQGTAQVLVEEDIIFAYTKESNLPSPATNSAITVVRKSPGAPNLRMVGQTKVVTTDLSVVVAAYHIKFYKTAHLYRLIGASGLVPAVIYIAGKYL
jgi:hypothetical protein